MSITIPKGVSYTKRGLIVSIFGRAGRKGEKGISLLETIVALVLLGIIGVSFLSATATTTRSRVVADEHVSARIIAEAQLEGIREQRYAPSGNYALDPLPSEYAGYSVNATATAMYNGNMQKIAITVSHFGKVITTLESYKTRRVDETS